MGLGRYISGKAETLEFKVPYIITSKNDTIDLRNKILSIDPKKMQELNIIKSTLWYQQKKIKEGKNIMIYNKTKERIE